MSMRPHGGFFYFAGMNQLPLLFVVVFGLALFNACSDDESSYEQGSHPAVTTTDTLAQKRSSSAQSNFPATESINGWRIGDPFSAATTQATEWTGAPSLFWEADGLYHRTYINRTTRDEINVSCPDSLCSVASIFSVGVNESSSSKTSRGIGIGSTAEEVRRAYSGLVNAEESNDSTIIAGSVYGGLIFTLRNGKVIEIFMGAAAE